MVIRAGSGTHEAQSLQQQALPNRFPGVTASQALHGQQGVSEMQQQQQQLHRASHAEASSASSPQSAPKQAVTMAQRAIQNGPASHAQAAGSLRAQPSGRSAGVGSASAANQGSSSAGAQPLGQAQQSESEGFRRSLHPSGDPQPTSTAADIAPASSADQPSPSARSQPSAQVQQPQSAVSSGGPPPRRSAPHTYYQDVYQPLDDASGDRASRAAQPARQGVQASSGASPREPWKLRSSNDLPASSRSTPDADNKHQMPLQQRPKVARQALESPQNLPMSQGFSASLTSAPGPANADDNGQNPLKPSGKSSADDAGQAEADLISSLGTAAPDMMKQQQSPVQSASSSAFTPADAQPRPSDLQQSAAGQSSPTENVPAAALPASEPLQQQQPPQHRQQARQQPPGTPWPERSRAGIQPLINNATSVDRRVSTASHVACVCP